MWSANWCSEFWICVLFILCKDKYALCYSMFLNSRNNFNKLIQRFKNNHLRRVNYLFIKGFKIGKSGYSNQYYTTERCLYIKNRLYNKSIGTFSSRNKHKYVMIHIIFVLFTFVLGVWVTILFFAFCIVCCSIGIDSECQ